MRQTLLLDSTYYPLEMIGWKKAITLSFSGRAEVVERHDDVIISSTREDVLLPKVLRLFCKIGDIRQVKFNRMNVFYRDDFTCQYCSLELSARDLTLDHVYPKSKGGKSDWKNIVTACSKCNSKKGDKVLPIIGMKLKRKPKQPMWLSIFLLRLTYKEKDIWKDWFAYEKAS